MIDIKLINKVGGARGIGKRIAIAIAAPENYAGTGWKMDLVYISPDGLWERY
jgi:hypothetical protein